MCVRERERERVPAIGAPGPPGVVAAVPPSPLGVRCSVFGVWYLVLDVWGLGFGVWGLGFGVRGLGFGVWGFEVWG